MYFIHVNSSIHWGLDFGKNKRPELCPIYIYTSYLMNTTISHP